MKIQFFTKKTLQKKKHCVSQSFRKFLKDTLAINIKVFNESRKPLKSVGKQFYRSFSSFRAEVSKKKSILVRYGFEYYLLRRWLLITSIFVIIGRIYGRQFKRRYLTNQKHFAAFVLYLEFALNFEHFEKERAPYLRHIWNYWLRKTWLHKCMKGPC